MAEQWQALGHAATGKCTYDAMTVVESYKGSC